MKKIFTILALCAMTLAANAATYNYLCAITDLTVDTLASSTKNQYILSWTQVCKNIAEYSSKPTTTYTTTVKLYLNSDDRTLDGVYTTEGASETSTSSNVNDQTIGLVLSELYYGSTRRLLRTDSLSTFIISREPDGRYSISGGRLCFTAAALQDRNKNTYVYNYCYAEEGILEQGISPTPYVFGYDDQFTETKTAYDLTVSGINMEYSASDYGEHRYFLTLACTGTNRTNGDVRNYEVQLALYSESEDSFIGSYSTHDSSKKLLWASNCYVKDLQISKQRNLANDSISGVEITSKGDNKFHFNGGPLICTDVDMNYFQVYHIWRVTETHYYYFSNNDGAGFDFSWDGEKAILIDNPQAIEDVFSTSSLNEKGRKVLRDGHLFIEQNGVLYNAQGAVVK